MKTQAKKNGPPYARYAFVNPYNLSLVAGAVAATAVTGHLGLGLCAAAAEATWLLLAPESKLLQRLWFDKKWEAERAESDARLVEAKIARLLPLDQPRVASLLAWKERIGALARENPSFAGELVQAELGKLDALVAGFLDLGATVARCEAHLGSFDFERMNGSYATYKRALDTLPAGDPRRDVAERNVAVYEQRRRRFEDLLRTSQTARGQMELIENSFRLLADEIVTMGHAADLGGRLDELRIAVDAIKETAEVYEAAESEVEERKVASW